MKKIIILGLALTLMVAATACGGDTKATSAATTAAPATTAASAETTAPATTAASAETTAPAGETTAAKGDGTINLVLDDGSLVYKRFELSTDYKENPVIIVYFDYTNTGSKAASAVFKFTVKAFQNGVESSENGLMKEPPQAYKDLMSDVKPGSSLEVAYVLSIKDTTTDVEIEASPLIDLDGSKTQTQIIKIAE